jgi:hypothetical protein
VKHPPRSFRKAAVPFRVRNRDSTPSLPKGKVNSPAATAKRKARKRAIEGLKRIRGRPPADPDVVGLIREEREMRTDRIAAHFDEVGKRQYITAGARKLGVGGERDRQVQVKAADDASELANERRVESFEIGSEMKKADLSNGFIVAAVATAGEFEGIFNLMKMWRAESEKSERDAIITDIQDLIEDIAAATGLPRKGAVGSPSALDPESHARALAVFLDEWEREHGPFTSAELERAADEIYGRGRALEMKKGAEREYRTAADVLADVPRLGAFGRKLRVVDETKQARRRAHTAPRSFSDHMLFQDLVSVAMHGLITQKILKDPSLIEHARNTLERWISKQQPVPQPFMEWRQILASTPQEIAAVAIGLTEEATRLRSSSPLGCLLKQSERAAVRALFGKKS